MSGRHEEVQDMDVRPFRVSDPYSADVDTIHASTASRAAYEYTCKNDAAIDAVEAVHEAGGIDVYVTDPDGKREVVRIEWGPSDV